MKNIPNLHEIWKLEKYLKLENKNKRKTKIFIWIKILKLQRTHRYIDTYIQYYKFICEMINNKKYCDRFFAFFSYSDSPFIFIVFNFSYLSGVSFFLKYRAMMYLNLTWKKIAGSKHEGITVRWSGAETAHFIIISHSSLKKTNEAIDNQSSFIILSIIFALRIR